MTDKRLLKYAMSFRRGILGKRSSRFMCFAVCAPLQGILDAMGIETNLIEADFGFINHTWLEMADGRILDPTADQFGLDPVYLGPVPGEYQRLMQNKPSQFNLSRAMQMQPLTKRQREILDFIAATIAANGSAPSLEEIGRRFELSSLATVHKHLVNLAIKKYIARRRNCSRSITLLSADHSCPTCGQPMPPAPVELSETA